jgi:hypothetical protein
MSRSVCAGEAHIHTYKPTRVQKRRTNGWIRVYYYFSRRSVRIRMPLTTAKHTVSILTRFAWFSEWWSVWCLLWGRQQMFKHCTDEIQTSNVKILPTHKLSDTLVKSLDIKAYKTQRCMLLYEGTNYGPVVTAVKVFFKQSWHQYRLTEHFRLPACYLSDVHQPTTLCLCIFCKWGE